jgi:hypothetical protein
MRDDLLGADNRDNDDRCVLTSFNIYLYVSTPLAPFRGTLGRGSGPACGLGCLRPSLAFQQAWTLYSRA